MKTEYNINSVRIMSGIFMLRIFKELLFEIKWKNRIFIEKSDI